ncbi:hypothetical protein CRG98_005066 [Punica granatum]|uniref:Uncharacterized protein n=1 Tax=Punica granatum TaxID=22663 RepID=A0A2I0L1D2_PUNGR|nr:hypothetical protein CRG98_005066 [Punica granatum]
MDSISNLMASRHFSESGLVTSSAQNFLYGPECGLLSGPALRAFGSRGLGLSTFPWGRVTDTRERRSRHLSFYDPKVEGG